MTSREKFLILRKLLAKAFVNSSFYKKKFAKAWVGSSIQINSWNDFYALPLTSREELTANQKKYPPFGSNFRREADLIYVVRTSGTTTRPLYLPFSSKEYERWVEILTTGERKMGIGKKDVFCHLTPPYMYPFSLSAIRKIGARLIPGDWDLTNLLSNLEAMQVTVLQAYPSVLFQLIELAKDLKIELKKLKIRKILTVGEGGGGEPETKKYFESEWGAKVIDHYGSMEGAILGILCPNSYAYHLLDKYLVAEVIDPLTGKQARKGELVLTYLWREDFPLIRHRTGDLVEIETSRCECGNSSPRLLGGVLGRVNNLTKIRAKFVHKEEIEAALRKHTKIQWFEIVIRKSWGIDTVDIYLELPLGTDFSYLDTIKRSLVSILEFSPNLFPLFPKTLKREGFKKAKKIYDLRAGETYDVSKRRVFLSTIYLQTLYLGSWKEKLKGLLAAIKKMF